LIEEGEVHVLDVERGVFVPASKAGIEGADTDPAWDANRLQ